MKNIYKAYVALLIIFIFSCNSNNVENSKNADFNASRKALVGYLETDDIEIKKQGKTVLVSVQNSPLIERLKSDTGYKWTNFEAFSSVSAFYFAANLDTNCNIDSILVSITDK